MLYIVNVNSIIVSACRAWELCLRLRTCWAVVAGRTIVTEEISHAFDRAVELGRAKLDSIERIYALQRVEVAYWSGRRIS